MDDYLEDHTVKRRSTTAGPDYYLLVDVHVPGCTITGIKCKVYVDHAAAHRSRVLLLPDHPGVGRQVGDLRSVGLIGHFPSYAGPSTGYLRIPKFIIRGVKNQHWGPALSETRVMGYPSALIKTTKLTSAPRPKAHVVVWLHGGRVLRPTGIQERSYTGVIRLVRKWRCRARLGPQALIFFDEHTAFPKGGPPEGIAQLVLRTDLPSPLSGPEITLRRYEAELETE